jgi:hypothetical protein
MPRLPPSRFAVLLPLLLDCSAAWSPNFADTTLNVSQIAVAQPESALLRDVGPHDMDVVFVPNMQRGAAYRSVSEADVVALREAAASKASKVGHP